MAPKNRYQQLIEHIFFAHYTEGAQEVEFNREEFETAAQTLGLRLPKNLGDIIYSVRYRTQLPQSVIAKAPAGQTWIIRPAGRGRYRFVATVPVDFSPNSNLAETKVPNATPGIIELYSLNDEQALLAKIRYNRLIDIFTGVTCYSLQNHLRTTLRGGAQIETDEIYVGVDRKGAHYVFTVQAKSSDERLGAVQVEQDFAMCAHKFASLICRPIGAQFIGENLIALFEFELSDQGPKIVVEKHYRLVPPQELTPEELVMYSRRSE